MEREAALALTNNEDVDDIFIPECTGSGSYRALQSDVANSSFWCVDPGTGVEIEGTRRESREEGEAVCEGHINLIQNDVIIKYYRAIVPSSFSRY